MSNKNDGEFRILDVASGPRNKFGQGLEWHSSREFFYWRLRRSLLLVSKQRRTWQLFPHSSLLEFQPGLLDMILTTKRLELLELGWTWNQYISQPCSHALLSTINNQSWGAWIGPLQCWMIHMKPSSRVGSIITLRWHDLRHDYDICSTFVKILPHHDLTSWFEFCFFQFFSSFKTTRFSQNLPGCSRASAATCARPMRPWVQRRRGRRWMPGWRKMLGAAAEIEKRWKCFRRVGLDKFGEFGERFGQDEQDETTKDGNCLLYNYCSVF